MMYTKDTLESALEDIDSSTFNVCKNKWQMNLPSIVDQMFIIAFYKYLIGELDISTLSHIILIRAYEDLNKAPGYFQFDD